MYEFGYEYHCQVESRQKWTSYSEKLRAYLAKSPEDRAKVCRKREALIFQGDVAALLGVSASELDRMDREDVFPHARKLSLRIQGKHVMARAWFIDDVLAQIVVREERHRSTR